MSRPFQGASLDLARMPARPRRYSYGLRSESSIDGWYAGARSPRKARPKVDPTTNLVGPVDDEDAPVVRVRQVVDYSDERHLAGVIVMADF